MKVTQLDLAGQGAWPDLALERLSPELNVVYGPPRTGKSAVAQLAAHLLYGKASSAWRRSLNPTAPLAEGSLQVTSPQGQYVLRRRRDGSPQGRLMVAAVNGTPVDGRTVRALLCDVSPRLLAELFAVDFAEPPRAQALLDSDFSRQFTQAINSDHDPGRPLDRRRVDALVRRRDEVVRQIEEQMSGQLRESAALEDELVKVEASLAERRQEAEQARLRLNSAQSQLAEIEARLRVVSLEAAVRRGPIIDADEHRAQLERLDAEIARCRQMLSDLQARQATVRRELAEVQPDGAADSAGVLADQRATVGVLESLLDDLDAEVAQLARGLEPGRPAGPDAHARLAPVAEMLRHQLYALCGQVAEHERATRRLACGAESRQLDRAQTDLSEQLGHLLERRQALVHAAEAAARPVVTLAQAPTPQHCQCLRHDEFVRRSGTAMLARPDRARQEEDARRRRAELERERDVLRASCNALDRDVQELADRWQRLQSRRAQAAGRTSLDELRAELERLEMEINRALIMPGLAAAPAAGAPTTRSAWKASDALAQLTGGRLVQIRLVRDGREAVIVDDAGRALSPASLSAAQQDQLYLALTLALVSSLGQRGVELPLVLDEPFLRQDAVGVRAMAALLGEFAREGRQVLVFTADAEAARTFTSQGAQVWDIDRLRRREQVAPPAPAVATSSSVRVLREPIDGQAPKLRLASHALDGRDDQEVFYLSVDSPLAEFPVLGNDTAAIFAAMGLHIVEDLLTADAQDVARRLKPARVSADAVRLWQRHMSLMCFLPGVSLSDAQVLAACDIGSPAALHAVDVPLLADAVDTFLASERGRRYAAARQRYSRDRLVELQKLARRGRDRWRQASRRYPWVEQPSQARAIARPKPSAKRKTKPPRRQHLPLRFLLERTSPVTAAPSITRRRGELLAKAGIRTVADLLNANPDSTAQELATPTVTPPLVARWQSEARLAVRIPALRRSAARILVACGFTEPEQIAGVGRDELATRVAALCRTAAGRRLLGKTRRPTADRIAQWISRAAHTRPLEAA